mgnify:CR=1 FL=1
MALRGCDLAVSVYVRLLVLVSRNNEPRNETNRQQNKQHDSEPHPYAESGDGTLRGAPVSDQKVQATSQADGNGNHDNYDE